jgi:hypothetical protein
MRAAVDMQHFTGHERRVGEIEYGIDDLGDFPDSLDWMEWYLRGGPRRFSELLADIPGVSSKVFSARLKRLDRDGILTRHVMPTSPPTVEYSLTNLGHELTPAINAIVQVGHKLKRRAIP